MSDALAQRLPPWPRFTRGEFQRSGVPLSLHDTCRTYDVAEDAPWVVWLTYGAFYNLEHPERLELLTEQRRFGRAGVVRLDEVAFDPARLEALTTGGLFVWWPQLWSLLDASEREGILRSFVETDRLPCRRDEIASRHWTHITTCLPGARNLAGSFLPESGGNCLGTVIAAFGAPAVAERWVHPEPFERWLEQSSPEVSIAEPSTLGRVLVWRDDHARIQHAAVGLGEGFVLHKEAQGWYAPRQVSGLGETLARWQDDGRLSVYKPEARPERPLSL